MLDDAEVRLHAVHRARDRTQGLGHVMLCALTMASDVHEGGDKAPKPSREGVHRLKSPHSRQRC